MLKSTKAAANQIEGDGTPVDSEMPAEVMVALARVFSGVLKRDSNLYLLVSVGGNVCINM